GAPPVHAAIPSYDFSELLSRALPSAQFYRGDLSMTRFWTSVVRCLPARLRSSLPRPRSRTCQPRLEALEDMVLPAGITFLPTHVLAHPQGISPQDGPAASSLTPSQVRHAYGFDQISFQNGTVLGDGSGQTI